MASITPNIKASIVSRVVKLFVDFSVVTSRSFLSEVAGSVVAETSPQVASKILTATADSAV
jgi:hypothetical protein